MASLFSYIPVVNRLLPGTGSPAIEVPAVTVHNVETAPEKRPRTLKHLLRANHVNHAVVYHDLQWDNHLAHALSSAYLLGASAPQLHRLYDDAAAAGLEPWRDAPAEVVQADWRDFLGDRRYQRAYVDFFEDALALRHAYDWKHVVDEYMYGGEKPLVNGLICGRMSVKGRRRGKKPTKPQPKPTQRTPVTNVGLGKRCDQSLTYCLLQWATP